MPSHSNRAGELLPELAEAYALGKMLDHSGWNGLLRDRITPSDIDIPGVPIFLDNNGAMIFADLTTSYQSWDKTLIGQRRGYEALCQWGPHCSVLCRHSVKPGMGRKINTLRDVEQFQVMVWDFQASRQARGPSSFVLSPVYSGKWWQAFVQHWVNYPDGPMRIRRKLLGRSVGMILKPANVVPL